MPLLDVEQHENVGDNDDIQEQLDNGGRVPRIALAPPRRSPPRAPARETRRDATRRVEARSVQRRSSTMKRRRYPFESMTL
jgi:hypothetical protein